MIYSSTKLKPYNDNCPGALSLIERGVPYDRELFQPGIAAHAVLQGIAEKGARDPEQQLSVADAVTEEIISKGRSYDGQHEPPMAASAAFEGRDIALHYLLFNELPESILSVEGGYGITENGQSCGYNEECAKYRAAIDLVYEDVIGDEEWAADIIVVRDYKSAWPTGEAELGTLQRKGQAVLTYKRHCTGANAGKYAAIRQEAVNLRTGMPFTRDINLDDEGLDLLKRWEKDILMLCRAADRNREFRPGAGCMSCRFHASCEHILEAYKGDSYDLATQYIAVYLTQSHLAGLLKERTREEPIKVNGGKVGYRQVVKKVATEDAHQKLVDQWTMEDSEPHPEMKSLLKSVKLTSANIDNCLKVMLPGRGSEGKKNMTLREALLEEITEEKIEPKFDVMV